MIEKIEIIIISKIYVICLLQKFTHSFLCSIVVKRSFIERVEFSNYDMLGEVAYTIKPVILGAVK